MTNKERILHNTIQLISKFGSVNISTKKIAEECQVSEGLIFRHYSSKAGLISAINLELASQIDIQAQRLSTANSSQVIKNIMEAPFQLSNAEIVIWTAAMKLIWEEKANPQDIFQSLYNSLDLAFQELNFLNSKVEAQLVMWYVFGFFTGVTHEKNNLEEVLLSLRSKYGLN